MLLKPAVVVEETKSALEKPEQRSQNSTNHKWKNVLKSEIALEYIPVIPVVSSSP